MRNPLLALIALATLAGPGCAGSDDMSPPDGGADDADGGGGVDAPPFTRGVSMLSGDAEAGYVDGERGVARFANPVNVALGPDGRVYVADFDNGKIRAVDAADGRTSTVVSQTGFQRPFGLAFGADGALYVTTDRDPQGQAGPMAGTLWRVDVSAGTATPIAARIGRPRGITALPDGRLAATDYMHHVIELIDPRSGAVTPLAGAWDGKGYSDGVAAEARFSTPYGLALAGGALVVADHDNHRLRRVGLDGTVSTLAGEGTAGFADGAIGSARFNQPQGLAAAANGDLYVTDAGNFRVRRVRGGSVETIAGSGQAGYADADDRLAAQLYGLEGLCALPDGSAVFVADGNRGEPLPYNRIRVVKLE